LRISFSEPGAPGASQILLSNGISIGMAKVSLRNLARLASAKSGNIGHFLGREVC
jgi:hypothetical protein